MPPVEVGFNEIIITLIILAAGGVGGRRIVKQDNAWERIVQRHAVELSKARQREAAADRRADQAEALVGEYVRLYGPLPPHAGTNTGRLSTQAIAEHIRDNQTDDEHDDDGSF